MCGHGLARPAIPQLAGQELRRFADQADWQRHLEHLERFSIRLHRILRRRNSWRIRQA
jgi:hypothetical protein